MQVTVGAANTPAEQQADRVAAQVTGGARPASLLVDDGSVQPGQMLKSQFLDQLRGAVTAAANEELGPVWSAVGCPYIDRYFGRYAGQPAAAAEALLHRYAPDTSGCATAAAMIPIVVARVCEGVRQWKDSGKPPAGLPEEAAGGVAAGPAPTAVMGHGSDQGLERARVPGLCMDGARAGSPGHRRRRARPIRQEGASSSTTRCPTRSRRSTRPGRSSSMISSPRTHELVFVLLACVTCHAADRSQDQAQEQSMTPVRTGPITVGLSLDRMSTSPKGSVQARITIRNASEAPVQLNKRLLVAYENIIDRDVYFEVSRDGKPYVGTDEYEQTSMAKALDASFYRSVAPGEELTRSVDLRDYYRFPSGSYRIRAVYAPQPSNAGKDAWSGSARSNEVVLDVK